jgi:hypothetical protein
MTEPSNSEAGSVVQRGCVTAWWNTADCAELVAAAKASAVSLWLPESYVLMVADMGGAKLRSISSSVLPLVSGRKNAAVMK